MTLINVTNARKNLYKLIEDVNDNSSQITITNSNGQNAVLMSLDDYNSLMETVYLYSVPRLVDSILKADAEKTQKMNKYNPKEEW